MSRTNRRSRDRITKADLDVGMLVEDEHDRTLRVTALEKLDGENAPRIGPSSVGYVPGDAEPFQDDLWGVAGVVRVDCLVRIVDEPADD